MRVVIQRVLQAAVRINGSVRSSIGAGLLVFLGIEDADTDEDIRWICGKLVNLRVFDDENRVMNRSVTDTGGQILLVSQFTLHASTKKGNRPSYIRASKPEFAIPVYEKTIKEIEKQLGKPVATGVFAADMKIELVNDGPVTIIMDSKSRE